MHEYEHGGGGGKNIARCSDVQSYDHHNPDRGALHDVRSETGMEGGQGRARGRRKSIACMLVWMIEVKDKTNGHCL